MAHMIFWRAWHVHNQLTHDKPSPPVKASWWFLYSYVDTLLMIHQPQANLCKGKEVVSYSSKALKNSTHVLARTEKKWTLPVPGRLKLNVDGSYVQATGAGARAWSSVTITTMLSVCHELFNCTQPWQQS
jgi:hypothetical protein